MMSSSQGTTNKVAYTLHQDTVSSGAATNGGTSVSGLWLLGLFLTVWMIKGLRLPVTSVKNPMKFNIICCTWNSRSRRMIVSGSVLFWIYIPAKIFLPWSEIEQNDKCYKYRHDFSSQDSHRSKVYEQPQSTGSMGSTFNWIFYKTPCSFTAWPSTNTPVMGFCLLKGPKCLLSNALISEWETASCSQRDMYLLSFLKH